MADAATTRDTANGAPDVPGISESSAVTQTLLTLGAIAPPRKPGLIGQVGRYEILRELGAGGMGIVYLARDQETGDSVAVKMIKPGLEHDANVATGFDKELKALKMLTGMHPHFMPVLETASGKLGSYYVMPYMQGGTLAHQIARRTHFGPRELLDVVLPIADAAACAHRKMGIIHSDIKPANILFDASGKPYLADYGLVWSYARNPLKVAERAHITGTPAYMSPGVVQGVMEDGRRDIYSLGAVMYEMVTGRPPYEGQDGHQILRRIVAGPPVPIRQLQPDTAPGLVQIIEKAMARELRDRYASMDDLVNALKQPLDMLTKSVSGEPHDRPVPGRDVSRKPEPGTDDSIGAPTHAATAGRTRWLLWCNIGALAVILALGVMLFTRQQQPGAEDQPTPFPPGDTAAPKASGLAGGSGPAPAATTRREKPSSDTANASASLLPASSAGKSSVAEATSDAEAGTYDQPGRATAPQQRVSGPGRPVDRGVNADSRKAAKTTMPVPVAAEAVTEPYTSSRGGGGVPTDQIRTATDKVIAIAADPALKGDKKMAERRQKMREEIGPRFNWEALAKGALASYWDKASEAERKDFTDTFRTLLERTYMRKIEGYSGETVKFVGANVKDGVATVNSLILTTQQTEIPLDYKLTQDGDAWQVVDVYIEKVSLLDNYRDQFNEQLKAGGTVADLVKALRKKNAAAREK